MLDFYVLTLFLLFITEEPIECRGDFYGEGLASVHSLGLICVFGLLNGSCLACGAFRVGRMTEQQFTSVLSLSLALFVPPTEDSVELFKLTEDKRHLVCQ